MEKNIYNKTLAKARSKSMSLEELGALYGLPPVEEKEEINTNYLDPNNVFINPYTFIPIANIEPERGIVSKGDKTGVIECSIEILSPTFIPNTTKKFATEVSDHYFYEFYSYDDLNNKGKGIPQTPVIPGSEIRGMVRNVYEQLTNSCFLEVDENNLPYKRTPQPKKAVVLKFEQGKWKLYTNPKIIKVKLDLIKGYKQGERIDINFDNKVMKVAKNTNGEYILHLTEEIYGKSMQLAFEKDVKSSNIELSAAVIGRFTNVIASYCNEKINKKGNRSFYEAYQRMFQNKETILVYADETLTYLSPSCMTKEYFVNTIDKILEKQGNHNKCIQVDKLCPACRLFGVIGKEDSNTGRVRFADSFEGEEIIFGDETVLPILGTPKISATEFYLKEPEGGSAATWNYDYYTNYKTVITKGENRKHDNTEVIYKKEAEAYNVQLMGRKVYWHGWFKGSNMILRSNMNISIRPITKGTFKIRVYFENISEEELINLIFSLNLNDEGLHKIGKGKPIGMGDIKVSIDSIKYRRYELSNNIIKAYFDVDNTEVSTFKLVEKGVVKQILTYTRQLPEEEAKLVDYPSVKATDSKGYEWFGGYKRPGQNREVGNRGTTVQRPTINQTLPHISENKTMKKY